MDDALLEENLPVLGEPVPIELANTRYRDGGESIEFLASPGLVSAWFDASPTATQIRRPERWTDAGRRRLIEVRDAADELLRALIDGRAADASSLERLNAAAALMPRRAELVWSPLEGPERVERSDVADDTDAALGELAIATIDLLGGPEGQLLRICANDDCEMLFLKHHHRRRWCHNSCGHRHRQAAYYRAHRDSRARA
jgi:predicted RNA-binding Zn ribbon-like protein